MSQPVVFGLPSAKLMKVEEYCVFTITGEGQLLLKFNFVGINLSKVC